MKKRSKGFLVVLGVAAAAIATLFTAIDISVRRAVRKYDNADHKAILAACRDMLAHRESYKKSPNYRPPASWEGSTITLARDPVGYGPDIPKAIRALNPMWVVIHEDSLIISDPIGFPPMRRGMIAFPVGTEFQYGTRKYLDGLWYWNSHLDESVRPEFDRRMDEEIKRIKANHQMLGTAAPPEI